MCLLAFDDHSTLYAVDTGNQSDVSGVGRRLLVNKGSKPPKKGGGASTGSSAENGARPSSEGKAWTWVLQNGIALPLVSFDAISGLTIQEIEDSLQGAVQAINQMLRSVLQGNAELPRKLVLHWRIILPTGELLTLVLHWGKFRSPSEIPGHFLYLIALFAGHYVPGGPDLVLLFPQNFLKAKAASPELPHYPADWNREIHYPTDPTKFSPFPWPTLRPTEFFQPPGTGVTGDAALIIMCKLALFVELLRQTGEVFHAMLISMDMSQSAPWTPEFRQASIEYTDNSNRLRAEVTSPGADLKPRSATPLIFRPDDMAKLMELASGSSAARLFDEIVRIQAESARAIFPHGNPSTSSGSASFSSASSSTANPSSASSSSGTVQPAQASATPLDDPYGLLGAAEIDSPNAAIIGIPDETVLLLEAGDPSYRRAARPLSPSRVSRNATTAAVAIITGYLQVPSQENEVNVRIMSELLGHALQLRFEHPFRSESGGGGSSSSQQRRLMDLASDQGTALTNSTLVLKSVFVHAVPSVSTPIDVFSSYADLPSTSRVIIDYADADPFEDVVLLTPFDRDCGALLYFARGGGANTGTFELPVCIPYALWNGTLTTGDFNGDGFLDYLLRPSWSQLNGSIVPTVHTCLERQYVIFFGDDNGVLSRWECIDSLRWNAHEFQFSTLVIDPDHGVGILSQSTFATVDPCSSRITLLRGSTSSEGAFSFTASCVDVPPLFAEHSQILTGDFNADGVSDLFFVCDASSACGGCEAGTGGMWLAPNPYISSGSSNKTICFMQAMNAMPFPLDLNSGMLALLDLNNDHCVDVVSSSPSSSCSQISTWFTNCDPSSPLQQSTITWSDAVCSGPAVHQGVKLLYGDINGDGVSDMLLSHDDECQGNQYFSSAWLSDFNSSKAL